MVRSWIRTTLILGLTFTLAGCGNSAGAAQNPAEVKISQADAGKTISLAKDDTLVLTLPGNPTTGYTWEAQPTPDEKVLQPSGEPQFTAQDPNRMGSPGEMTFRFTVMNAGQTALKMVYHRPWETQTPPQATFEVTIVVE